MTMSLSKKTTLNIIHENDIKKSIIDIRGEIE